jgi:predicted alpha/beta hydrolase
MLLTNATHISFKADDAYPLAGTLFESHQLGRPKRVVVVNSGAGVSASYYGRFAGWLAAAGIPTLTYDYRGIGRSRPQSLRRFSASIEDWGSKDCAAAIRTLLERYPGTPIADVGHSIGCFLTGFVNWRREIDRMVFVTPHTGYFGDYAPRLRPLMWFVWHLFMPAVTSVFGYFPGRLLQLPEDLPRGVAKEWANRRKPDFWWNLRRPDGSPDLELRDRLLGKFAAFHGSALAIRITDDAFSTSAGSRRVAGLFTNLAWKDLTSSPQPTGALAEIGHFGFFRANCKDALWPIALTWLLGDHCDLRTDSSCRE